MNRDQIEFLQKTESARIAAEAHGYEATAEALAEILTILRQDLAGNGRLKNAVDPLCDGLAQGKIGEMFQVVS